MARPVLLDLFCRAGGASVGYYQAGFDVVGVDIEPQPRYPFKFIQADALQYLTECGGCYAAVHASPPCQGYSVCATMPQCRKDYPMLIEPTRAALIKSGRPFVIENVVGSPLKNTIMLCGLMFGLKVFRHRLFESNLFLMSPAHVPHKGKVIGKGGYVCVAGHGDSGRGRVPADHRTKAAWSAAMEIDWMQMHELSQALPPAYCRFIGLQLREAL